MKLTFEDLTFEVPILKKDKKAKKVLPNQSMQYNQIVKSANGYALPGQTLFIMGASGAGKTSLLNMLSDRISLKNGARVTGNIFVNDSEKLN